MTRSASFWSNGTAYGTVEMKKGQLALSVLGGSFDLSSLGLPLGGGAASSASLNKRALPFESGTDSVRFPGARLSAGDVLEVEAPALAIADLPDINGL